MKSTFSMPATVAFRETESHRSSSRRDPAIRHAGRVSIRGKIRRVWRPRYLELCDSGFIRYYELPSLADVTMPEEADWQHVNMVIKDTLIIHHARIIDVTTLRDLHVGLPRGSFGFLFRGQRVGHNNNLNIKNSDIMLAGGNTSGDLVGHHHNSFVDMQHEQMDAVVQSCSNSPVGGDLNPPREYFCAVSTLEEAQSWVIALQWSVKICQKTILRHSLNESDTNNFSDDINKTTASSERGKRSDGNEQRVYSNESNTQKMTSTTLNHSKKSKSGRILVTKVCDFRIIRVDSLRATPATIGNFLYCCRWEVAYEVALLFVEKNNRVEERRILLTAHMLEDMLREISKSTTRNGKSSIRFLDKLQTNTENLPRFHHASKGGESREKHDNLRCTNDGHNSFSNVRSTPQTVEESVAVMDGILRALAMEATVVNSRSMRQVFGLDSDRPSIEEVNWLTRQKSKSIICGGKNEGAVDSNKELPNDNRITAPVLFRQVRTVPSTMTVDDYVRQWLARPLPLSSSSILMKGQLQIQFLILQRPWLLVGGLGAAIAVLHPFSQIYQRKMMSITMRLDILALALFSAFLARKTRRTTKKATKVPTFQFLSGNGSKFKTDNTPRERGHSSDEGSAGERI